MGGQTLSYDTRGNLTGDGTWTYSYDAENRLTCANKTGTNATFAYDPLGRRVKKSIGGNNCNAGTSNTYYLSDGSNEIAEYTGAGAGTLQYRYVPGPAIDDPIAMVKVTAPAATTYFHENKTGSVVAMSGSTSALSEGPYTYDAYGAVSASTGVAFKFTGRRLDPETGLYYYRARYYTPAWGRFMQTDSVGYGAGMNLYIYVGNDPTNKTDPTGKASCPSGQTCPDIPLPPAQDRQQLRTAVQATAKPNTEVGGQSYTDQKSNVRINVGPDAGRSVGGARGDFEQHISPKPGEKLEEMSHTHLKSDSIDPLQAKSETQRNNAPSTVDQNAMNKAGAALQTIGPDVTTTMYRMQNTDHLRVDFGDPSKLPSVGGQGIVVDPQPPEQ